MEGLTWLQTEGYRKIKFSLLMLSLVLSLAGNTFALEVGELANKIAWLHQGEVWMADKDGRPMKPITKTSGKVEDFLFSPAGKHLAYSKIIRFAEEPGLWEAREQAPQRAVCSIVIMDLKNQKVLKEIMPPKGNWIYPAKWLGGEKLLFYESSGFDVGDFFEYELQRNIEQKIDYHQGSRAADADFHPDGSLMVYTDDTLVGKEYKMHLHLVDLKAKTDKIIVSQESSVLMPKISYDKKYIAFVQVERINSSTYFDNLWIYNIKEGSLKKIYRGPAVAKTAFLSRIAWSFDYKFIAMFCSPKAVVLEIQNPGNLHKIRGIDFNWRDDNKIIYAQEGVYLYNLDNRKKELLFKDASKPKFWGRYD